MLDFNRQNLTHMTADALKKQRGYLWIIAILLLAGGVACLMNPLISGVTLSYIIGGLLLINGISMLFVTLSSRLYSGGSKLFSVLVAVAYLLLGYVFLTEPLTGMLSLAILLAILFIAGGILRLGSGLRQMSQARGWLNIIIGLLDLFIAYLLVGNGPIVSVTLIATLVGIELLFSSFGLIAAASGLKKNN